MGSSSQTYDIMKIVAEMSARYFSCEKLAFQSLLLVNTSLLKSVVIFLSVTNPCSREITEIGWMTVVKIYQMLLQMRELQKGSNLAVSETGKIFSFHSA